MRTPSSPPRPHGGTPLIWLALAIGALGCGGGSMEDAGTGGPRDSGPRFDGGRRDAGPTEDDAGARDAGPMVDAPAGDCAGLACGPFQYCDSGTCRDYPACRGDGTCDRPGDVCHARRCVPSDVDVDGDGYPAGEDCDETDPDRNPGESEICNSVDDDCDGEVDDGDPAVLCEFYPGGGICDAGSCGCPPGTFDLDRSISGCECMAAPAIDQGLTCDSAIDIGDLADSGQVQTVTGNVLPDDRDVWYQFRGVDSPDTSCDNYHVRAQFTSNPDDTFELTVFRGSCNTTECDDSGYTDFTWATDMRATIDMRLAGQCPCAAAGAAPPADVSICEDDTESYFVRVRRRAGSTLSCASYTIELSNGLYDTP